MYFNPFLGPLIGILGGAVSPVLRAMMSEIVSADDQGIWLSLCGFREG